MDSQMLSGNWSVVANHLPQYVFLLFGLPMAALLTIKLGLSMKSASEKKAPKQWVISQDQDAEGIPVLASRKYGMYEGGRGNVAPAFRINL